MEIALAVLSIISLSFMIAYMAVVKRLNLVSDGFEKLLIAHNLLLDDLKDKQQFEMSPEDQDAHKENFIKFLSDSRDWAFDYIENVQSGLKDFINTVEKDISYFDKYGEIGSSYPHYSAMLRISSAYKELKNLLPEDSSDRR